MSKPVKRNKPYRIGPPRAEQTPDGTRSYRVVYEIDLVAASPQAAALEVYEILRDPESPPPVFTILDSDGDTTEVDLYQQGLAERWGQDEESFTLTPPEEEDPVAGPPQP
jgi:hypothetical protein